MAYNLKGRSFLTLLDYTPREIAFLINLACQLKIEKSTGTFNKNLQGKNIALLFEKASTRTRCAFTVAAIDEGAHAEYLGKNDIQLGKKESVKDTARVLGRMFDGIQFRGFAHETVEILAQYAGVPVWNGLTDTYHPTQVLADFMTILEEFGYLEGISLTYVGDGRNNVANSLMIGSAKMGMDYRVVSPSSLFPDDKLVALCREIADGTGADITVTDDITKGVSGTDVIYTDVWASMGEESKIAERIALLKTYQVNKSMFEKTGNPDAIFLHCLPCFHNLETDTSRSLPDICEATDDVFESGFSRVFDEAENRVHTIKAVMVATLGK
ncbi:ornithine carbamoyltransferase [bacterium]|nr:ornithine carbamoyltransferase [candidate division CSSED10-310 bacterium]